MQKIDSPLLKRDPYKLFLNFFFSEEKFRAFISEKKDMQDILHYFDEFREWPSILKGVRTKCNVIDECVYDLLSSLLNASQAYYRSAISQLRSFLELVVLHIYYIDHPIEYIEYMEGNKTTNWFELCGDENKYFTKTYLKNFYRANKIDNKNLVNEANRLYRALSKYVHGRPKLRHLDRSSFKFDLEQFKKWLYFYIKVIKFGNTFLYIRFNEDFEKYFKNKGPTRKIIKLDILESIYETKLISFPKQFIEDIRKIKNEILAAIAISLGQVYKDMKEKEKKINVEEE